MSEREVRLASSPRIELFTKGFNSVVGSISMPLNVHFLRLPFSMWRWLKERRRGERRWEYILGLAAFALVVVGTTFSGLQWQLARLGNRLSEQSNAIAMV